MNEDEGFLATKARRKKGSRGKSAEDKIHEALIETAAHKLEFDFDRLLDSRAAGRIVAPTVADFNFCYQGRAGVIEVKSTKHEFRLSFGDFPQFPRIKRRMNAGGIGLVAIYHSKEKLWRIINVNQLEDITRGSWNLKWKLGFKKNLKKELMEEIKRAVK